VGSWRARNPSSATLSVTVSATDSLSNLTGWAQISGGLDESGAPPLVERVNQGLLAPGGVVTIAGSELAAGERAASENPLPTELGETLVAVAGAAVPLISVSPSEIKGVLPYEIAANTRHSVIVQRGPRFASSGLVTIAPAQPVVTSAELNGRDLTIRATGLGAVDPPLPAGTVTPEEPVHSTIADVDVQVGGATAVVNSASLLPGETGVYVIRATAPDGVAGGDVVVTVASQSSAPFAIAAR
jgi:uncharacterized protein (TIGR03437 family)